MADSPAQVVGNVNWGSNIVNGQLVPQAPTSAFFPLTMGTQYTGPRWATQQPYGVPPVIPSPASAPANVTAGTAPTQAGDGKSASAWHPTKGVLFFGFLALVGGIFMLHYVHYGNGKK